MKAFSWFFGLMFAGTTLLSAQEETIPKFEVGLTYSGLHLNAASNNSHITGNGGSGSFEYNVNRYLGVVADFGGYANTKSGINEKEVTYLFGPRFNWRRSRFTPYAQALFGGGHAWSGVGSNTQDAFAMAIGGGVDVRVTKHVAIKPVQVEYFRSQFNSETLGGATSSFGRHQNGVRYSAGVALQFGTK